LRAYFVDAAAIAGSERRPVFRVARASLRPLPMPPTTFSRGMKTSRKEVTEFSMPRRPMKALRVSTVIPGESQGQMNAVIPPLDSSVLGTTAMTITTSAIAPFVAQSFVPFTTKPEPSSVGTALVVMRAGSDPTSGSVSRKAEMWVLATFGSHSRFCSSEPNMRSGSGSPMDWWAERRVATAECHVPARASALL